MRHYEIQQERCQWQSEAQLRTLDLIYLADVSGDVLK